MRPYLDHALHLHTPRLIALRISYSLSLLYEPNTAMRAPALHATVTRRLTERGRRAFLFLRAGPKHGAVRGASDGRGWGLTQRHNFELGRKRNPCVTNAHVHPAGAVLFAAGAAPAAQ